jgi:aspartate kinase
MRVFKFGGASVKNAEAVQNVASIISHYADRPLVVVVSAIAKTTNALEEVVHMWQNDARQAAVLFSTIVDFHRSLVLELFDKNIPPSLGDFIEGIEENTINELQRSEPTSYGQAYDAIVHKGELLATRIISEYLQIQGQEAVWTDTRQLVITNAAHRRATVNWKESTERIGRAISQPAIYLVQGFIGSTPDGIPTTLGREGSDYTAAVFAHILNAEEVTIWKDVPGVLNGDPKVFNNTVLLEEISYREAIELAYYGASVIHPKTIQPLQEKGIPLSVKSFLDPAKPGSLIRRGLDLKPRISCYILKTNQALVSISTRDLAFIVEEHLQLIYSILHKHGITVNTMQNSAISSSFCVDHDQNTLPRAVQELETHFDVRLNTGLELYTIRHHTGKTRESIKGGKEALLEQITRNTYQVVLPA